ncbi:MAG: hypothetical protein AAGI46_13675 [Planctomycetota bacterium]
MRMPTITTHIDTVDLRISQTLERNGIWAMRYALAFVFVVFGILKPLGVSPAAGLVLQTVNWVPLVSAEFMLHAIGWWEVAIGISFLARPLLRLAILLLAMQMVGTFLPLVVLPDVTWQSNFAPTMEGQYILKNLLIIAGAMIVGGTARTRNDSRRL